MITRLFLTTFICVISSSLLGQSLPDLASGEVIRYENFDSKYVSDRNVDIWLPKNYDPASSYNVLYMHDGQMLFDSTKTWNKQEWGVDEVVSELIETGQVEPVIVVGIWNISSERHSDYFPKKPFDLLPDHIRDSLLNAGRGINPLFSGELQSDNYLKFIVEELKPFIDSEYSTKNEVENTFIMGSSMGGLISMYALMEYPEVFGGAACLSTHWVGGFQQNEVIPLSFTEYINGNIISLENKKLYFDYGTTTLDALYPVHQKRVDKIIKSEAPESLNYKSEEFKDAAHTENDWRRRLDVPITFLMGAD